MIKTKKDLNYYLEQDRKALGIGKLTIRAKIRQTLKPNEIWKFERLLRKTEYYSNRTYKNTLQKWGG